MRVISVKVDEGIDRHVSIVDVRFGTIEAGQSLFF